MSSQEEAPAPFEPLHEEEEDYTDEDIPEEEYKEILKEYEDKVKEMNEEEKEISQPPDKKRKIKKPNYKNLESMESIENSHIAEDDGGI